jgi:uncharacterized protein (UPF0248 family)/2'-5' RNA ligase
MRTSEEIYQRIRWDPRFDPARFVLGINVHGAAPQRVPLPTFVPGGDIPWHRVMFIEADGEVVWDRVGGVDRLDESPAGRVPEARPQAVSPPVGGEHPAGVLDVAPTAHTALAWIPPARLWPPIQRVRRQHDPQVHRWPPHVNLLFGFVPEPYFELAAMLAADAVSNLAPFTARLDGVHAFRHRNDATVWLDPAAAGPAPWAELHRELVRRFPRCRGRAEGYVPHLSLGRVRDPRLIDIQVGGMDALVCELVLLSRRGSELMQPRVIVELGTGQVNWPDMPTMPPCL